MSVASKRNFRAIRYALLVAASAPLALAAAASAETAAATDGTVRFGSWGVDLNSRDLKANPGDDFERYASGAWMDATEIPADKSQNGVGSELNDRNQERLQSIVTGATKDSQLGALFTSYMDEARLEQLDAAPLKADLARVDAIKNKAEFSAHMAETFSDFGSTLFAAGVLPDPANPTMNIAFVGTSGMGLPDRDYYLLDKYKPQRDAYRAYIQRTLELTETPNASAAADTHPRVRDGDRQAVLAAGGPSRPRQAQQSDDPGPARRLCAGRRLGQLPAGDEGRLAQADRRRQYGGEGAGGAVRQDAAGDAQAVAAVQGRRPGFRLSVEALRRQQVRVHQDVDRRDGAAPALAPRHRADRRPAGRGARPDLCPALFLAAVEGDDGRAGRRT